jgi:hypothetical protein
LPFAFMLAAYAIVRLSELSRNWSAGVLLAASLAVVGLGVPSSWELSSVRSGFAAAQAYVVSHDGGRSLTASEIMAFYLQPFGSRCSAPALPVNPAELAFYAGAGFRVAILERHQQSRTSAYIVGHDRRLARFLALGTTDLTDNLISSEDSSPPPGSLSAEFVDVYELKRVRGESIRRQSNLTLTCSRERLI